MSLPSSQLTKSDIYLNLMETTRSTSRLRPFYLQGVYTNTVKGQFIPFLTGIIVGTSVSSSGKLENQDAFMKEVFIWTEYICFMKRWYKHKFVTVWYVATDDSRYNTVK